MCDSLLFVSRERDGKLIPFFDSDHVREGYDNESKVFTKTFRGGGVSTVGVLKVGGIFVHKSKISRCRGESDAGTGVHPCLPHPFRPRRRRRSRIFLGSRLGWAVAGLTMLALLLVGGIGFPAHERIARISRDLVTGKVLGQDVQK